MNKEEVTRDHFQSLVKFDNEVWFEEEDNSSFNPGYEAADGSTNLSSWGTDSGGGVAATNAKVRTMGLGDTGYSFRSAMHEIGHTIGLAHNFISSTVCGGNIFKRKWQRNDF